MDYLFSINTIMLTVMGYPLSYAEFIGTLFGLLSVFWASRTNILTWPAGIANEIFFFAVFFQVQLYANMLLQAIFFVATLYGWYSWKTLNNAPHKKQHITSLSHRQLAIIILLIVGTSILLGMFMSQLHTLLPNLFPDPAAAPYTDATIMMISIAATLLLARKKLQSWLLWIINNIICIILYFTQGIYFIAIEYIIFLFIASYGLYQWKNIAKAAPLQES